MQPVQITINIPHNAKTEQFIKEKINKLTQYNDNIISCQVMVDFTQQNQMTGNLHTVHLRVLVPGRELVVNHHPDTNLYRAIQGAVDHMRGQLKAYKDHRHSHVKSHPDQRVGAVVRLFNGDKHFGFIEAPDGNEFYFNADNLVSTHFDQLHVGDWVYFTETMGREGQQAHHVKTMKRYHHHLQKAA